jgi:hypothetical protein
MRIALILFAFPALAAPPVHVWEEQELTFTAARSPANPYTDAMMPARHGRNTTRGRIRTRDSSSTSSRGIRRTTCCLVPSASIRPANQSPRPTSCRPRQALRQRGAPPFGTLLTANPAPSTLLNWGDGSWVGVHQFAGARFLLVFDADL